MSSPTECASCHKDSAEGFASIKDNRYCHGDDDPVTCYMRALEELTGMQIQTWDTEARRYRGGLHHL